MILLRTQAIDPPLSAFADELERLSGEPVLYLVDERKGPVPSPDGRGKISLNFESCRALGLYCPSDFAWRCGDYGFYIARAQFRDAGHFWLIESDVRLGGQSPGLVFDAFNDTPLDLLASFVEPAPPTWPWYGSVESRDRAVWKCFFPIVRLSAAAIDRLHAKRCEHGRQLSRRIDWPNDEAFVATELVGSGMRWADFNGPKGVFYDPLEFSFDTLRDLALPLPTDGGTRFFHPVLGAEALDRKRARLAQRVATPGLAVRALRKVKARFGVAAIARRVNRLRRW